MIHKRTLALLMAVIGLGFVGIQNAAYNNNNNNNKKVYKKYEKRREHTAPLRIHNTSMQSITFSLFLNGKEEGQITLQPGERTDVLHVPVGPYAIKVTEGAPTGGLESHLDQATRVTWDGVNWTKTEPAVLRLD